MDAGIEPGGHKEMSSILATNSGLVYEPKCGGRGGGVGCEVSANEYNRAWSPNKLWRSNSIFNLWVEPNTVPEMLINR
jgi:hypothetical protein